MSVCVCVCICVSVYVCAYICLCVSLYLCMYICVGVYMCANYYLTQCLVHSRILINIFRRENSNFGRKDSVGTVNIGFKFGVRDQMITYK